MNVLGHWLFPVVLLTLIAALACQAKADELRLSDGSTLTGTITNWSGDSITIHTDFAGDLSIPLKLVKEAASDQPVLVQVTTGDKIIGKLVIDKDKGQLLTGTTFGDLKADMSRVTSITSPTTRTKSTLAGQTSEASATTPKVPTGAGSTAVDVTTPTPGPLAAAGDENPPFQPATPLYTTPPSKWTARVELGADGSTGNTERFAVQGRIEARRTTDIDRLLLYLQGTYAKQNGARSANEVIGGADLEVDLTKRLFVFGKASLEYDEFENLNLRAMVTGGLGYFWIRQDDQFLKTRAGIGYQHESFMNGQKADTAILELGVDYMKQITPWLKYNHSTTYYPTLSSVSDFRIVMENAAELPITKDHAWKFKIGMKNTYDSQPEPGVERLDTTYFANLVWDFM